ncbi:autophagy-related protein 13b isoform X2 [Cynara cardunculus var. scolymus]|uniref:autophagy-related protein 13b isoform X2 n=1 Tax=Cynara cardunculus var. scolymus TaxID=59895 RepID=UPI000D62D86E|nr:autophagy-related protein 13b isoform X2 [Cynara cardunculus var. scolymus]
MAVNPHSEPAKMEQIITEFFAKSLHIILESRCPYVSSRNYSGDQIMHSPSSSASSSSSMRPRDKWFNLTLRDCPAALENIDFWRQSNLEPMVVDVVLVQRSHNWDYGSTSPRLALERNLSSKERFPFVWKSDSDEFGCDGNSEKIIERWVVQYESKKGCKEVCSGSKRSSSNSSHALYKKSILLLRSLYVTVRLLPAYKIFREINSSGQIRTFSLIHRVSSSVEPLLRRDEAEMQQFMFAPVDTSCGKLCISLSYLPSISDATSESSTPMSPQFIPDYVGSPLADPLKRLPSVPMPQYSPSSSPFGRRHSWSYDTSIASPPSALPSPSPTYSESRTSYSKFGSHRPPTSSRYPLETAQVHTKDTGYDEYLPSPNFSPSPSPSPPMYLPGSNMLKVLLRSDSAPVYIPTSRLGDAPVSSSKTGLPFSPPLRATRPSLSLVERSSSILQSATTAGKLLSLREEDIARPSGVKISGPFVVDDDDMMDPGSRPGSSDRSGNLGTPHERIGPSTPRKSQDAAVGALVQMLKKAPPLRQDLSRSQNVCKPSRPESSCNQIQDPAVVEVGSSSMASSRVKTTSDALEELKAYMDVKQLLLRQSGKS